VVAMDIGTGVSCVFPLLGLRLHPDWKFIATGSFPQMNG
jgi:23S rRNA A1618 N6-methylase RlmF